MLAAAGMMMTWNLRVVMFFIRCACLDGPYTRMDGRMV